MTRNVAPVAGMALTRKHGVTTQFVKQWREQQHDAGHPSGLENFYRAHGFCWTCRAEGKLLTGVRWRDSNGIEQTASLGTDEQPIGIADLVRMHNLDERSWDYLWEQCDACRGTGKVPK